MTVEGAAGEVRDEPVGRAQQRRLAAARRTDRHDQVPLLDVDGDVVERGPLPVRVGERHAVVSDCRAAHDAASGRSTGRRTVRGAGRQSGDRGHRGGQHERHRRRGPFERRGSRMQTAGARHRRPHEGAPDGEPRPGDQRRPGRPGLRPVPRAPPPAVAARVHRLRERQRFLHPRLEHRHGQCRQRAEGRRADTAQPLRLSHLQHAFRRSRSERQRECRGERRLVEPAGRKAQHGVGIADRVVRPEDHQDRREAHALQRGERDALGVDRREHDESGAKQHREGAADHEHAERASGRPGDPARRRDEPRCGDKDDQVERIGRQERGDAHAGGPCDPRARVNVSSHGGLGGEARTTRRPAAPRPDRPRRSRFRAARFPAGATRPRRSRRARPPMTTGHAKRRVRATRSVSADAPASSRLAPGGPAIGSGFAAADTGVTDAAG